MVCEISAAGLGVLGVVIPWPQATTYINENTSTGDIYLVNLLIIKVSLKYVKILSLRKVQIT